MKKTLYNLYQRDYFTFYLIAFAIDLLSVFLFKLPLATLLIFGIVLIFATVDILKKFKK